MAKRVIEASMAVALGAKLCKPAVIPMYPITPQTHIVEYLAEFINDGNLNSEMIHAESEHSALSACIGAQATGVRTFTATSSQGLALMHEILYITSGMRIPVVMAVANRALSAPINIWNDHSDSMAERDSGWLQFYVESAQEALDTVLIAYKIAENKKVLLPVMVCLDGFTLSHVFEPVDIPGQKQVDNFLPKYNPLYKLDPKKPLTMGPVGFPDSFMEFRKQQQDAMEISRKIIEDIHTEFKNKFKRSYDFIETYKTEDAKTAIIALGSVCGTIRTVVDELRKKGEKVGLIKIRCFRPFPEKELIEACKNLKSVGIIDRSSSPGYKSAVSSETGAALKNLNIIINDFIAGLGGRDITKQHIKKIFNSLNKKRETEWLM